MNIRPLLLLLFFFACSDDEQQESSTNSTETEHFIFKWTTDQATVAEIDQAKVFAEQVHTAYADYFGSSNLPDGKTIVNLGGDAFTSNNAQPKIPYVDENREIFLFRFGTGYLGELPHEYVHVLRLHKGWSSDGFLEEGLAEAVASRLFQENVGFSLYGFPTTIAAGTWLRNDQLIPLQDLKDRHFDINLKCLPQSYTLRADFFNYLLEEYDKEDFMDFIYSQDAGTNESYSINFAKSLSELETDWLQNLQLRLDNFEGAESQITVYKEKIDELRFYICEAGIDF